MALAATAGIVTPVAFLATPAAAEGRTAGLQPADHTAAAPHADGPSDVPTVDRETAQPGQEAPAQESKPSPEVPHEGVATPDADTASDAETRADHPAPDPTPPQPEKDAGGAERAMGAEPVAEGADSEPDADADSDADTEAHVVDVPDEFLAGGDWSYFRYLIRHVAHDGNYTAYMELFDTTTTLRGEDVEAQFYVNGAWGPAARLSEDYLGFVILDGVELHEDTDIPVRLKFKDGTSLGTFVIVVSLTDGNGGDYFAADVPSEIVARHPGEEGGGGPGDEQEGSGQEGADRPGGDGSGEDEDGREGGDRDRDGRQSDGHEEAGEGGSGGGAELIASALTKPKSEPESLTTFVSEEHGTGDGDGSGRQLAHTGMDAASSWALGSGGVALLLGSAFVAAARRKQGRLTA